MCITDPTINEVDGIKFLQLREWILENINKEGQDVQNRFETMLENVNYHLSEATKQFG